MGRELRPLPDKDKGLKAKLRLELPRHPRLGRSRLPRLAAERHPGPRRRHRGPPRVPGAVRPPRRLPSHPSGLRHRRQNGDPRPAQALRGLVRDLGHSPLGARRLAARLRDRAKLLGFSSRTPPSKTPTGRSSTRGSVSGNSPTSSGFNHTRLPRPLRQINRPACRRPAGKPRTFACRLPAGRGGS